MKAFSILLFLLFSFAGLGQTGRLPYKTVIQSYRGDTLVTTIGDTVKQYTNADAYSYNKPFVIRDTSLLELIEKHGGGGATLPGSLNEILLSDGAGGAATNTSIKWDADEGGLFISNLSHDTVYLRPTGLYTHDGRQLMRFALGYHPTTGFYYQSILRSSEDLANLNKAQVRTYANSKHNYVYLEVERNPNYLTQAVLDSSGFYLLGDFDTTLWGDAHLVTSRWVLDRLGGSSEYTAGNGIGITEGVISWNPTDPEGEGYSIMSYQASPEMFGKIDIYPAQVEIMAGATGTTAGVQLTNTSASIYSPSRSLSVNSYGFVLSQLSGSLTDGAPTEAEITTIVGYTAVIADEGSQVTIRDTDGTGLLYKIESDGTNWYYTVMTKAL